MLEPRRINLIPITMMQCCECDLILIIFPDSQHA